MTGMLCHSAQSYIILIIRASLFLGQCEISEKILRAGNVECDSSLRHLFSVSQDSLDEYYDSPKISLVNNIMHNNEGMAR
jgi:hypothetical protein